MNYSSLTYDTPDHVQWWWTS